MYCERAVDSVFSKIDITSMRRNLIDYTWIGFSVKPTCYFCWGIFLATILFQLMIVNTAL